ncbi:type VI secretion system ATPase TssH [Rhizobium sp. AAP43]|uniref:type VI secretion system ATPase TssH n=1 Tax=Rhizobium sp. AAP43 TaxID=1523420 RepID=UPI0009EC6AC9|nr:type VI secretion system ATPase TssH [Rhizobium sp. AAP43]
MPQIEIDRLVRKLEPSLHVGLETAASIAVRFQHPAVDLSHWLRALTDDTAFLQVAEAAKIDIGVMRRELDQAIADIARTDGQSLVLSENILTLCREAWLAASLQGGRELIAASDILVTLLDESSLRIIARGTAPSLLRADRAALEALRAAQVGAAPQSTASVETHGVASAEQQNEFLRLYTRDLTEDARQMRLDPVIGRQNELRQVIDILMRRRQNNPILVGEPGVGKTAVAEALAIGIACGDVPERLKAVRLLLLDLTLLQAGAGVKGEFERRLHGVVDAVKTSMQPIILFVDEAHSLIGAGGQAGQGDAANILKPALARGELRTIAATTWSEYKRFIEKDAALTRRFQIVQVLEPNEATAIRMVRGVAPSLKRHHGVRIRDEAIQAAVKLSARYLPARQLPDKAISLLDTAAASVALARQTRPEKLSDLAHELKLVTDERTWLLQEPETEERNSRIEAASAEIEDIRREISVLEVQHAAEVLLVQEADRLEQLSAHDEDLQPASTFAADNVGNVAVLAASHRDERPEVTLLKVERSLAEIVGDTALVPRVVNRDVVAAVLARWTGIPVGKLLADQVEAVCGLDQKLSTRVLGQDRAITRIAAAMRAARAGLADPTRPPAVFLLVGMSGTGKTETALSVADMLYGGSQHLTTINMSEFKEEHKVSMLVGSPPGYVGYGEGGVLTEAVRRRPFGVLLLDEIDKAHPGVQDIFYQVFDKGALRDGEGRDIDFRNTTIFMTANTGSELLAQLAADPETMPEGEALEAMLLPELQKHFKPAFLGRTTILPFMPLTAESLLGIIDIQLERIKARVLATYGAAAVLAGEARSALVAKAQTSEMGARAIELMIMRDLMPVLSTYLLGTLTRGVKVTRITIRHDGHSFTIEAEEGEVATQSGTATHAGRPDEETPQPSQARGGHDT